MLKLLPGLAITGGLAWISFVIQKFAWFEEIHLNSLIIVIILGIVINNLWKIPKFFSEGIRFAAKKILRLAIILLGFKLSFAEVAEIGGKGLLLVTVVSALTMLFAFWLGRKMQIDDGLTLTIGAGTSICGASAVAAVGSVVKADEKDTTFALAAVTVFGTLAMFVYPVFYRIWDLPQIFYAVWAGSSIHEVAQVVAAGFAASNEAGQFATLVKLTRVLLLIPLVIILSIRQVRLEGGGKIEWKKIVIPWFVFGFLAVVIINSLGIVPTAATKTLVSIDTFLLTWAMAGLGLETSLEKMKKVGLKPFYFGFIIWMFIAVIGFFATHILF